MKNETEKLYPFLKNRIIRIYNPFNFNRILKCSEEKVEKKYEKCFKQEFMISVMRLTANSKRF